MADDPARQPELFWSRRQHFAQARLHLAGNGFQSERQRQRSIADHAGGLWRCTASVAGHRWRGGARAGGFIAKRSELDRPQPGADAARPNAAEPRFEQRQGKGRGSEFR